MHRPTSDQPFTCVTCECAIAGTPVFHVGLPFCCAGCVAGGPVSLLLRRTGSGGVIAPDRTGDRRGARRAVAGRCSALTSTDAGAYAPTDGGGSRAEDGSSPGRRCARADGRRRDRRRSGNAIQEAGADLRPGVVDELFGRSSRSGLVRVARGAPRAALRLVESWPAPGRTAATGPTPPYR